MPQLRRMKRILCERWRHFLPSTLRRDGGDFTTSWLSPVASPQTKHFSPRAPRCEIPGGGCVTTVDDHRFAGMLGAAVTRRTPRGVRRSAVMMFDSWRPKVL